VRSLVSGTNIFEIIVAYTATELTLVIVQTILIFVGLRLISGRDPVGAMILCLLICIMAGVCGMSFGKRLVKTLKISVDGGIDLLLFGNLFLVTHIRISGWNSFFRRNASCAFVYGLSLAVLRSFWYFFNYFNFYGCHDLINVVATGIFSPLEAMPLEMQYVASYLPFTKPVEALRSVYSRGSSFTHPSVWLGFATCSVYIVVITLLAVLIHRRKSYM